MAFCSHPCILELQRLCTFLLRFIFLCFQLHLLKKAQESRRLATGPQDVHKLHTLLLMKSQTNPTTLLFKFFLDSFQEDVERTHANNSFHTELQFLDLCLNTVSSNKRHPTYSLHFFNTSSSYVTNYCINFNTRIVQFNTSRHNCFFPDKLLRCFLQLRGS